ncbi:uncharacterized protein [Antedon mediterranea]|uniref:uncharacterized protein n=1 Tax=Antedon mediterranea TaxID=105859 RepID=UPI003AF42ADE
MSGPPVKNAKQTNSISRPTTSASNKDLERRLTTNDARGNLPQPQLPQLPLTQTPQNRKDLTERTLMSPISRPSTSSTPNKAFERTVICLLSEIKENIDELRRKVEHNTFLLTELDVSGIQTTVPELEELPVEFPIRSVESLIEIEASLDASMCKQLVLKLGLIGGKDSKTTTNNVLKNLLSPFVARQYNWTGAKGKLEFGNLKLLKVILGAVRRNPSKKDATREEIKDNIKSFLYNARDKEGGGGVKGKN